MLKLLSAVVAATALTAATPAPPASADDLAVALVRPDGILVPVAVFDGSGWSAPWPEPADRLVIERMIEGLPASYWKARQRPVPKTWHVARAGQPPLAINVLGHVVFTEQCGNQIGLLTDMQPRREVDSMPFARMLATDRLVAVEAPGAPVEVRPGAGPEGRLTLRPLGTLKVGGSTFRIVLHIGYEGESVSVMEIGSDGEREVLRTYVGGC